MSESQEAVEIVDRRSDSPVTATLHLGLGEIELINVEIDWAPARLLALRDLREKGITTLPEHVRWNWAVKAATRSRFIAFRSFGIEFDGKMQGLMMVLLAGKTCRLDPDKGKPLVYVDYVETAPWNAREFTDLPIYKGVGLRLLQVATRLSLEEGFSGRVGLHSLPQSRPFYSSACGMQSLGIDHNYQDLEYFELTAEKALDLLKK